MTEKRQQFKKLCRSVLAIILVMASVFCTYDVSYAAKKAKKPPNKAARITAKFDGKTWSKGYRKNGYDFEIGFTTFSKVTTSMKSSVVVYVPQKSLTSKDAEVVVKPCLAVCDKTTGVLYYTVIPKKYVDVINTASGVKVRLCDTNGNRTAAPKGMVKLARTGKFYRITIKNLPMENYGSTWNSKGVEIKNAINTNKVYDLWADINVACFSSKFKGHIYVDDIEFRAKKKLKITFNKDDYEGVTGIYLKNNKTVPIRITTIKVK